MAYGDLNEDYHVDRSRTLAEYYRASNNCTRVDDHERRAQLLLDQAAHELEKAEEARALLERFGVMSDYPDGSVIMWVRNFSGSRNYTYVALKVNNMWYLTSKYNKMISHARLVAEHLQYALDDEVWIVKEWTELL